MYKQNKISTLKRDLSKELNPDLSPVIQWYNRERSVMQVRIAGTQLNYIRGVEFICQLN